MPSNGGEKMNVSIWGSSQDGILLPFKALLKMRIEPERILIVEEE